MFQNVKKSPSTSPGTYKVFWFYHVHEHQDKRNRDLHFAGVLLGLVMLGVGIATETYWLCLGLFASVYLFAAIGHYFFERNRPETARQLFWSFIADLHMFGLMCLRRMDREVRRMRILRQES